MSRSSLFAALLPVLLLPTVASAQDPHSIEATFAEDAPRVDGHLDDPIWATIEPVENFVQRWPEEGAAPTERSWAKVAYDRDNLYFAFRFFDRNPELIRAKNMERGGRNDRDDHAYIGIDTFLDGRNAYLFEMNALGTQDDALIADEHMTIDSYSWDAVFESETVIDEKGWSMEVRIPFRQLRFPEGDELTFGLFMRRTVNRKNEIQNWPLVPLTYGSGYSDDLKTVSRYGRLTGIRNIRRGRNLEIKPYVITGAQSVRPNLDSEATMEDVTYDAGVDVKYGLTSNLALDLTVNTDFAQVEADNTQLNLTRFSLFFPEKREFFLERAGIFEHGDSRRTQTFFSRRIGLTESILMGGRLTGQVGRFNIGLLGIETGPDEGTITDKLGRAFGPRSANNAVARIQTNYGRRGSVGAIVTSYVRGEEWNRAYGFDVQQRFGSASSAEVWYTTVRDDDPDSEDRAGSAAFQYFTDTYGGGVSYTSVGENYKPALGFVRRRDMRRTGAVAAYTPFLSRGPFRQGRFQVEGEYITGQDAKLQTWALAPVVALTSRARMNASLSATHEFDRLEADFNIRPDAVIVADDYTFTRVSGRINTDPGKRLSGSASVEVGGFYSGNRTDWTIGAGYRHSKHLTFGGRLRNSVVRLPVHNGDFNAVVASVDVLASVSRKLFSKALIQYDNFSRNISANIRINWIHTPGSDLFLVFKTSYHVAGDGEMLFDPRADLLMNSRIGVAKLTYLVML